MPIANNQTQIYRSLKKVIEYGEATDKDSEGEPVFGNVFLGRCVHLVAYWTRLTGFSGYLLHDFPGENHENNSPSAKKKLSCLV